MNPFKTSASRLLGAGIIASALAIVLIPAVTFAQPLDNNLSVGSCGSDVSALQLFLSQNSNNYPTGMVTGYFGSITEASVSNFQTTNGISANGAVGPITLPVLNLQMSAAPLITAVTVGVNTNSAIVSWNTSVPAEGVVYYSTSPLTLGGHSNYVYVSGNTAMTDAGLHYSQSISIPGLQSGTTYYYSVYSTNTVGNASVTWPSTFQTSY
ncbi:MAG: peptidoglycan-binding protein [Candidatus Pacebacteria bacterium]|nr:peptidoglycan-binding protein [Candidatus Paceibacterota bacterium]